MTETTEPKNNNSMYLVAAGIVAILLISVGAWAFTNNQSQQKMEMAAKMSSSESMMKKDETAMMKDGKTEWTKEEMDKMEKDHNMTKTGDQAMMTSSSAGKYVPYSADLVSNQKSDEKVVVFFNASWCSSCQSTIKDINTNKANIPSNVSILSADYDKEQALKQKYGVTMQHTFVLVDKDGNMIKKANGLGTVKGIADFAV